MTKRNAWKVEPKLIDRFLDVITDNGYRWPNGEKANGIIRFWDDHSTILFIENKTKTLTCLEDYLYLDYFYLNKPSEEYNLTEVTEEWLKKMENESFTTVEGDNMETQNDYMGTSMDYMELLIDNVDYWARKEGITEYKHWKKQFMRFQETALALHTEMVLFDKRHEDSLLDDYRFENEDVKLEMGNVLVNIIVLAAQQDLELSDCLISAMSKIKKHGKIING